MTCVPVSQEERDRTLRMGYYKEGLFTKGDSQSVGIREPKRMAPWPGLAGAELLLLPHWKGRSEAVTSTLRNSHGCCSVGGSEHSQAGWPCRGGYKV